MKAKGFTVHEILQSILVDGCFQICLPNCVSWNFFCLNSGFVIVAYLCSKVSVLETLWRFCSSSIWYSVNADSEASSQLTFLQEELAKTGEKSSAVVKE
uniref:Uncharacterized protein n=1 Tax=Physcomitrium patens TaxID=3218 RepID=A0A2K1JRE8_PHYPA|nr:hypothetical protein PHYPA_016485 [Physcomitrium patens]